VEQLIKSEEVVGEVEVEGTILALDLLQTLLDAKRVVRITFTLDKVEVATLVSLEERVLEHVVGAASTLRLVEVIHVQLADEG